MARNVKGTLLRGRQAVMTALTRRHVLGLAAAGAGAATLPLSAGVAAAAGTGADFVSDDLDLHLLRRTTYGVTPGSASQIQRLGRRAWLDQQLRPASINDSACDQLIRTRFPRVGWTIPEARDGLEPFSWDLMFELAMATMARAAWSKRQLFEVMCRLLVQPPQRHQPERPRVGQPPGLRPAGDPHVMRWGGSRTCSSRARRTRRCCST